MGDYSWIPAAGSAIGGALGAAQQNNMAGQSLEVQRAAMQRALDMLNSGELGYTASLQNGVGPSAYNGISPDAGAVNAQQMALQRLEDASKEGYNSVDRAAINAMLEQVGQQERGSREAVLSHIQPGSGQSIAARLGAQQAAAGTAHSDALGISAGSRMKALDALSNMGNLSSNMRNQSFNEQATKAGAADAISKFNSDVSQFNAGAQNTAAQNGIGNRLNAAQIATGAGQNYAAGLTQQGNTQARQLTGLGGAAGNAVAAGATANSGSGGGGNTTDKLVQPYPDDPYQGWTNYGQTKPDDWAGW